LRTSLAVVLLSFSDNGAKPDGGHLKRFPVPRENILKQTTDILVRIN
jgi:hypothetical protein